VALVRKDVSEESIAFIIRVKSICELGTTLAVTSNLSVMYMKNAVFGDVTPCESCEKRPFRGTFLLHHQSERISELKTSVVSKNSSSNVHYWNRQQKLSADKQFRYPCITVGRIFIKQRSGAVQAFFFLCVDVTKTIRGFPF
jgi:hypothetical protein